MTDKPTPTTDQQPVSETDATAFAKGGVVEDSVSKLDVDGEQSRAWSFFSRFLKWMTHPFLLESLTFLLPLIFAMWCTYPVWSHDHLLFMGRPTTDNVVTPWFYDFVARRMWAGEELSLLKEFDYPNPHHYSIEFPSATDAQIFAPVAWLLDWPEQWAWTIVVVIVLNTFAVTLLGRVIGLGRLATIATGVGAVLLRPLWADILKGRMNVVTPCFAILAMVGVLLCFPKTADGDARSIWVRLLGFGLAYSMGITAALVYPPFLLILIPVGVVLVLRFWWNGGFFSLLWGALAAGAAYATIFDRLWGIYFDNYRVLDCSNLTCPDKYNSLTLSTLALWEEIPHLGLSLSGIQGGGWLLLPLVLLNRRWRWEGLAMAVLAVTGALLSLGPCPASEPDVLWRSEWVAWMEWAFSPIWCASMHMHDFGRFGLIVGVVLCLTAGMTLDGMVRLVQGKAWWLKGMVSSVGIGLVGYSMLLSYTPLMQEILSPQKWYVNPYNTIAEFLKDKPGQTVAELPFDRSYQFLSALEAPEVFRVNPIRPFDPPRKNSTFYLWLYAVARGEQTDQTPNAEQIRRSGLNWVLFDPKRCEEGTRSIKACEPWVREALIDVLGTPEQIEKGVLLWRVTD